MIKDYIQIPLRNSMLQPDARLQAVLPHLGELVFILDSEQVFQSYHQARSGSQLWLKPEFFLGKKLTEIVWPDKVLETIQQTLDQVFRTLQPSRTEYTLPMPDGLSHFSILITPVLNPQEQIVELICIVNNITQQKLTEQALKDSQQRWRFALEGTGDGIWDWQQPSNQVFFSEQWKQMLGYAPDEIGDQFSEWETRVHPEDLANCQHLLAQHVSGQSPMYSVEHRLRCQDGTYKWILTRGQVIERDSQGQPLRMIGTHTDISQRKALETSLQEARLKAESANQAKSDFLANMSHEFRTPLNGLLGFSRLLHKTPLNAVQQQYLQAVTQSGQVLLELINDVLDFSKIEAGKLELERQPLNPLELVEEVIDLLAFQAHSKALDLLLRVPQPLPTVIWTDPVRLRQVLTNLLSNAVKFTTSGEVELSLEVLSHVPGQASVLRFGIRDTGLGIAASDQQQIFEAFSQADASMTRRYGGTGLGLAISSKLLKLMHSQLKLDSQAGQGSHFYFDLEVQAEDVQLVTSDKASSDTPRQLLVVSGNPRNALNLQPWLPKNWHLHTAFNAAEAIQATQSQIYDVLMIDQALPDATGLDLIEHLRQQALQPEAMLIWLHSSAEDPSLYQRCTDLHVEKYLFKPIKQHALLACLDESYVAQKIQPNTLPEVLSDQVFRILVAEDNPINLLLSKTILQKLLSQVEVLEAHNGHEALQFFQTQAPDLILMDLQMPGMSGYEATQAIRKLKTGTQVPILALTATALQAEKARCLAAGMNDYLTKPLNPAELAAKLQQWLMLTPGKES